MSINNNFIEAYEDLHREYYSLRSSKEYCIGVKVVRLINSIKKRTLWNYICEELRYRKKKKYNIKTPISAFKYGTFPKEKPRIAVYSCVTGGYDNVESPKLYFDNIDYILFTDDTSISVEGWEIRSLPPISSLQKNNTLKSRFCKMHPNIVGNSYDYAFFIDGNICIYSDITNMINVVNENTGLAIHRHGERDCIFDEFEVCKISQRGVVQDMERQVSTYKSEGFPSHFGLLETTVILSDLHNTIALKILEKCWAELSTRSTRDQLALPYAIWKLGFTIDDIGNLGFNLHINPKFRKISHQKCISVKDE